MYPKDVPDLVADQYNRASVDNIYDYIKKVWPVLAGGKKLGVKPGSNIKADKNHKD